MNMPAESALVILVPEAEPLVGEFRKQYDPSAAVGIPAHVTVLYPFKEPGGLTAEVLQTLELLFAQTPAFQTTFTAPHRFPNVLYLSPEPADPFRRLIKSVADAFPDTQPYGGEFTEIIPHLTVAHLEESDRLEAVASAFARAAEGRLPLQTRVREVVLMENTGGLWGVHRRFALKPDPPP